MKEIDQDIPERQLELCERLAVTGSHNKLPVRRAGFTLVELMVVILILGVLAILSAPAYDSFVQKTRTTRAVAEIKVLEKEIIAYFLDYNLYPNSLAAVGREKTLDIWKNPYQYLNIANGGAPRQDAFFNDLNTDFDLYSLGPDGLSVQVITDPNGLDDIVRATDGSWIGKGKDF